MLVEDLWNNSKKEIEFIREKIGLSEKSRSPMSRGVDGICTQVRFSADRSIQSNSSGRRGCVYMQIRETPFGGFYFFFSP